MCSEALNERQTPFFQRRWLNVSQHSTVWKTLSILFIFQKSQVNKYLCYLFMSDLNHMSMYECMCVRSET